MTDAHIGYLLKTIEQASPRKGWEGDGVKWRMAFV